MVADDASKGLLNTDKTYQYRANLAKEAGIKCATGGRTVALQDTATLETEIERLELKVAELRDTLLKQTQQHNANFTIVSEENGRLRRKIMSLLQENNRLKTANAAMERTNEVSPDR